MLKLMDRLAVETKLPLVAHLDALQHDDVVYASKIAAARALPSSPASGCGHPRT